MSQPWWYSGDEAAGPDGPTEPEPSQAEPVDAAATSTGAGMDWMLLLAGAQRVVDWATDRVLAPHSEHEDPRDHPECMVCRAMTVADRFDVGIPRSWPPSSGQTAAPAADRGTEADADDDTPTMDAITWIPIVDEVVHRH